MSNIETIADFTYNGQQFLLKTSKFDEHLPYHFFQASGYPEWSDWPYENIEQQKQFIRDLVKMRFIDHFVKYITIDDTVKKVIDVGSGLGINDLLMSQLRPDIDFHLVDKNISSQILKDTFDPSREPTAYFSKSMDDENYHGFYNSTDITKDIIQHSPINSEKIHFLDPIDNWPSEVEYIMSIDSWMWHYHKNIYWNRLLKSLKVGGHFAVTMTLRNGERTIEEISNDLGSYPYQAIVYPEGVGNNTSLTGYADIISTGYYAWQRIK
jgi:hypothetical protein